MSKRVLMIDDEADIREVAALSVETTTGWKMLQAESSAEGLRKAESEQPDAILLDLRMPDMDGRMTLAKLKENPQTRAIPVLLMTASTNIADVADLRENGLAGIISKPFDPLTLGEEISHALGWTTHE